MTGKRIHLIAVLIFLLCGTAGADLTDIYGSLMDFTPVDENAGIAAFPLLRIPMGGSLQVIAAAGTASVGGTYFFDANPAASVSVSGIELAVAHREWVASGAIESIGIAFSRGRAGFGVGGKAFYTPFSAYDDAGNRVGTGYFAEYVGAANASLRLVDSRRLFLDIGSSVKVVGRHVGRDIAPNQSATAFPFDFGLLMQARLADFARIDRKNLVLGISFKDFGAPVSDLDSPLPTVLSGAVAYSPFSPLQIRFGAAMPVNLESTGATIGVFSYAAGIEIKLARFLVIEAGGSLGPGNLRVGIAGTVHLDSVALTAAYSSDLLSGLNPLDTVSVLVTMHMGGDPG